MDLEGITVSDISQTEEDKYHIFSFTRGLKKKNLKTHRYREQCGFRSMAVRKWGKISEDDQNGQISVIK